VIKHQDFIRYNVLLHQLSEIGLPVLYGSSLPKMVKTLYGPPLTEVTRKNYLFAGSDAGGRRAATIYSLIESAKLNGLNPQHYLTDVLTRIADHPARHVAELLPWNWQPFNAARAAA
jgi:hypothetical protein